jgi:hypothetical protein
MNVQVSTMTGEYATDAESGQCVYETIHPELLAERPVELNFAGVNVFASAFFNFAIGQLLQDFEPERLNRLLKVEALSPAGHRILNRVIENAKRYYSDAHYQTAVDTVIEEYAASV